MSIKNGLEIFNTIYCGYCQVKIQYVVQISLFWPGLLIRSFGSKWDDDHVKRNESEEEIVSMGAFFRGLIFLAIF